MNRSSIGRVRYDRNQEGEQKATRAEHSKQKQGHDSDVTKPAVWGANKRTIYRDAKEPALEMCVSLWEPVSQDMRVKRRLDRPG